ncbi:hypothetical protein ACWDA3_61630 [Nonomuraea rubra]
MGFRTYARRVRDRDLPYGGRYRSLRCAVSRYGPIGFNATWSYLRTAGDLNADEDALLRALDVLEISREVWLTEIEAFASRRLAEKRQHRRTPSAAERLYLYGYRWPGPHGHQAMLLTVDHLWGAHLRDPFPDTPAEIKGDLVYLDSTIAGCISTYLSNDGEAGPGHRDILRTALTDLDRYLRQLGYPTNYYLGFQYFRRLRKATELIINDGARAISVPHSE